MTDAGYDQGENVFDGVTSLARLLQLARRSREAQSLEELGFIAVNETRDLVAYRQAVLWQEGEGAVALSGVVSSEANSPYVLWLMRVLRQVAGTDAHSSGLDASARVKTFSAADLAAEEAAEWSDWLPAHALWLPFSSKTEQGCWLLAREEPWSDSEIALLGEWLSLWLQAWALRHAQMSHQVWRRLWLAVRTWLPTRAGRVEPISASERGSGRGTLGMSLWRSRGVRATLAAAVILLLPVRLSVLAPGQLVPANPAVIRSPLDGIVDRILVQPNQRVTAGAPLLEFDRISIASRLEVARQVLATAQAEYRQFAQQAVTEAKSKGQMAGLQGRIEEKRTEVAYLNALNQRAVLAAPRDGIALLDEPSEWVGRPVSTGERIMVVADEDDAEIEAWLSPGDLIEFPEQAEVTIYLNNQPLSPVSGYLRYVAHEALLQPEGGYAYRLRARLAPGETAPRVGSKGSVKINGVYVPLVYWLLRKPLAVARGFVGV